MRFNPVKVMGTAEIILNEKRRLGRMEEELEMVMKQIGDDSLFSEVKASLGNQLEMIRREKESAGQMILALEEICRMVQECERRVMDEMEQEQIRYPRLAVGYQYIRIPSFSSNPLGIIR
ncbi:MAG: hypothetical protein ACOX8H_04260 [Ruminococcus sp.]|jgi:hypothetical protein